LDEGDERGTLFIKDYISRNIHTASGNFKAFDPFAARTIAKKNTLFRPKREFAFVVWTQIRPTSTSENSKRIIIRSYS
jgi:hypothetical protein